ARRRSGDAGRSRLRRRVRGSADAQGSEARRGSGTTGRSLDADGRQGRGSLSALRRWRRGREGFLRHHSDDRTHQARPVTGVSMRFASLAVSACILLLSSCGGPQTSQANNAQANISNDSRDVNQATAANMEARVSLGDAAKIMHARHEGMETIGKNFKVLTRQIVGGSPDLTTVRASAGTINRLAQQASGWFPEGTGPELGKTGAK